MRKLLILIPLLFICKMVVADPILDSINNNVIHGNNVTISGSSLGSKATPIQLKWDDFEDNDLVGWSFVFGGTSWETVGTEQRTNSSYCAHKKNETSGDGMYMSPGATTTDYYTSFWIKLAADYSDLKNNDKFFRAGNQDTRSTNIVFGDPSSSSIVSRLTIEFPESGDSFINSSWGTGLTKDTWHFVEIIWGIPVGQSDNYAKLRLDGVQVCEIAQASDTWYAEYVDNFIGYGYWFNTANGGIGSGWYYDDIYYDKSFARVMIGNASSYGTCTHFEMQPILNWESDGTDVGVTINQGSFATGTSAYLYVIDSDGNVSNGLPIQFDADIYGISGNLTDGGTIVINGKDFGTKSPAAPHLWDTFEGGSNGADIEGESPTIGQAWSSVHKIPVAPAYSNSVVYNGSLSAKFDMSNQSQCDINGGGLSSDEVYIYYKRYMDPATSYTGGTTKQFYLLGSINGYGEGSMIIASQNANRSSWNYSNNSGRQGSVLYTNLGFTSTANAWHTWEAYAKNNTLPITNNGVTYFIYDGTIYAESDSYYTTSTSGQVFSGISLGNMDQNNTDDTVVYYDDFYMDNTQSRVMIGNNENWVECTNKEIQIPTAWADGSVTVTVNQGTFSDGETGYLFVVDSDGVPSDQDALRDGYQGKEVQFGEGGGTPEDTTSPTISGRNPAPDTTGVSRSTDIVFHLTDGESGVDEDTIRCDVESNSQTSDLVVTGTASDYTCTLNNADITADTDYGVEIDVDVSCSDLSLNSMATVSYSFTLEEAPEEETAGGAPTINFRGGKYALRRGKMQYIP